MGCRNSFVFLVVCLVASTSRMEAVDFESDVAPIFITRCLSCHNPNEPSGGLDLTSAESLAKGGDSGEAVTPGDSEASFLLQRINSGEMPPPEDADPLSSMELRALVAWIEDGAPWPISRVLSEFDLTTTKRAGRDWWAFKHPVRADPPSVKSFTWVRHPIDSFIARKLEEIGLAPSPEAQRAVLVRRIKLNLLGLPPTPEEVRAFVDDPDPDAYEKLVDSTLASPRYGERWARHWLDIVRYGESEGYEKNKLRPGAWPFRDYVIDSFNDDKPYDQFVREQIAGDQIGASVATSFLVGGGNDTVTTLVREARLQQRSNVRK